MNNNQTLAATYKNMIKKSGKTQRQVAEEIGVSYKYLNNVLNGHDPITDEVIQSLSALLTEHKTPTVEIAAEVTTEKGTALPTPVNLTKNEDEPTELKKYPVTEENVWGSGIRNTEDKNIPDTNKHEPKDEASWKREYIIDISVSVAVIIIACIVAICMMIIAG